MSESFTVGDLKRHLNGLDDDIELSFSGGLTFYRIKRWGDDEAYIEFSEPVADLTQSFKKRNPNVLVAFIRSSLEDGGELVSSVSVTVA